MLYYNLVYWSDQYAVRSRGSLVGMSARLGDAAGGGPGGQGMIGRTDQTAHWRLSREHVPHPGGRARRISRAAAHRGVLGGFGHLLK